MGASHPGNWILQCEWELEREGCEGCKVGTEAMSLLLLAFFEPFMWFPLLRFACHMQPMW